MPQFTTAVYRSNNQIDRVTNDDLPQIMERCRIKAAVARWRTERIRLAHAGADVLTEIEPHDYELIEQAKQLDTPQKKHFTIIRLSSNGSRHRIDWALARQCRITYESQRISSKKHALQQWTGSQFAYKVWRELHDQGS